MAEFIPHINKKLGIKKLFKHTGNDFEAFYEAEHYAESKGLLVGSMCRDSPIALLDASAFEYCPKWTGIDPKDYKDIMGLILSGNFRNGDVEVLIAEDFLIRG